MAQVQRHESSRYGYAKMTIVTSRSIICWTNICKSREIGDCETRCNILRVRSRNYTWKSRRVKLQMFCFIINSRIADRINIMLDCYRDMLWLKFNDKFLRQKCEPIRFITNCYFSINASVYVYILALVIRNCRYWYLFNQSHIPPGSATYTSYTV